MKRLYFLLSFATLTGAARAQSLDTAAIIRQIRAEFQKINAHSASFKAETKDAWGGSTEGGEETLYYDSTGNLRKITTHDFGEMGQGWWELYIKNGLVFFAYQKVELYKKELAPDSRTDRWEEYRYYLYKNKVIRFLTNGTKDSPEYPDDPTKRILEVYQSCLHPQTE